MSRSVNFYKEVNIEVTDYGYGCEDRHIEYKDNHGTSWSGWNITKLELLFDKYTELKAIPVIGQYTEDPREKIVDPCIMSKYCSVILEHTEDDAVNEDKDRIEYIKFMSDNGYYISLESF